MKKETGRAQNGSRVSVFEVRLRCEAAPEIGCGLRAKPLLQDLERLPGVSQAWLNRAGDRIAIVRMSRTPEVGDESVVDVSRKHRVELRVLDADKRTMAVDDLAKSSSWYRAAAVDQLSSEEAAVIATRLVKRLSAKIKLSVLQERRLIRAVEAACANELIRNPAQSAATRKRRIASAVVKVAKERLEGAAFAAFAEAAKRGHRPLPGER